MNKPQLTRQDIARDTQLSLDVAAWLAFPDGTVTARILRAEAQRGKLTIFRIGKKYYTTLAEIDRMVEKCPVHPKERISISDGDRAGPPPGAFGTERVKLARAALMESVRELKNGSRRTLHPNTGQTSARQGKA